MDERSVSEEVEALNDRLAREHPIDEYYERSFWPIRLVEGRRLALIRTFMGDTAGLDVLEVGSGGGHVLRMFPSARRVALDVSSVYLETAMRNLEGHEVEFVKGEVDRVDWGARRFDRVICTEVLEHVVDPGAVIAAIAGLLRPTGIAVLTIPNDRLIAKVRGVIQKIPAGVLARRLDWGGDEFHVNSWTAAEFEHLVSGHLTVELRRMAPSSWLPLRMCFKCTVRNSPVSSSEVTS
jgi:2-polyprenyl-3-methyl-5-hydroxy-6-metoxy-1,4-benzoquinol methylase